MTKRVLMLALISLLVGCSSGGSSHSGEGGAAEEIPVPTREQLGNMIYEGIQARSFVLENGRFEGEPFVEGGASRMVVELLDEMTLFGDVDGDGAADGVVLLSENSGGSGTRIWLCVVSARFAEPTSYGCELVGDRPQIRTMRVSEGWIRLETIDRGPGDPACCPTRSWLKEWAVVEGTLTQVSSLMGDPIMLGETADGDWVLTHFDDDEPAPGEPEITLRFEEGKVGGSAACNNYFAGVKETAPGALELGPVGATRKMCAPEVMDLEQRYLERLGGVTRYGFRLGKLALTWDLEDRTGTLLFDRR